MAADFFSNPSGPPVVPDNWSLATIENICTRVTSGATPLRSKPEYYDAGTIPWIRTQELKDGIILDSAVKITPVALRETSAKLFPIDTVLMAMYGDGKTITSLGILGIEAATNQACCAMLTDPTRCLPRFLFYALRHHRQDFIHIATGGAQRNLSGALIKRFAIGVPPLAEQTAISDILGKLDDKIDLNRKMNETLEAMARALFKSWFVDFDPVRAKAEGRETGLPGHIADLFPDSFEESELGKIPAGWGTSRMVEHFEVVKGLSYKGAGLSDSGLPMHNLNSIYEGGGYKYEGIKHYIGDYCERHIIAPGDVIVANTEQGHERRLIGYAAVVPHCIGDVGIFTHHLYRVRPRNGAQFTPRYLCHLLNTEKMHDVVGGYTNGTTVNSLSADGLQAPVILCPPAELIKAFDSLAAQVASRCEVAVSESAVLTATRDSLLPKLISGEIRVPVEDERACIR